MTTKKIYHFTTGPDSLLSGYKMTEETATKVQAFLQSYADENFTKFKAAVLSNDRISKPRQTYMRLRLYQLEKQDILKGLPELSDSDIQDVTIDDLEQLEKGNKGIRLHTRPIRFEPASMNIHDPGVTVMDWKLQELLEGGTNNAGSKAWIYYQHETRSLIYGALINHYGPEKSDALSFLMDNRPDAASIEQGFDILEEFKAERMIAACKAAKECASTFENSEDRELYLRARTTGFLKCYPDFNIDFDREMEFNLSNEPEP